MDLSYLSYFVIVLVYCWSHFSFCCCSFPLTVYRKSKSGLLVTRHLVDVFFHHLLVSFDSKSHHFHMYLPTVRCFSYRRNLHFSLYVQRTLYTNVSIDWKMFLLFVQYIGIYVTIGTFIKPDGNEVDENGICPHWSLVRINGNKQKINEKSSRQNSTEISVIYFEIINCTAMIFCIFFFSYLSLSIWLSLSFHLCGSYNHYFKIQFKIICLENLQV